MTRVLEFGVPIVTTQISSVPVSLRQLHEPSLFDPIGLLELTRERMLQGADVPLTIDILSDGLWWMRNALPAERWRDLINVARAHPLIGLLHESPLLRRAFVKPRGLAGDAPLLDMVYGGLAPDDAQQASPLGLSIMDRDTNAPWAVAMRERRDFMAALIDHVAECVPMPYILAASCGHLSEGHFSRAIQRRGIGRFVALDADAETLAVVARDFGGMGIEPVNRNLTSLMDRTFPAASFDAIYAAGAYDNLPDRFARDLTRAMFDLLKPGGRLLISNIVQDSYDAGYLEAFGDWFMVYRNAAEVMELATQIQPHEVSLRRVYTRLSPEIFYLEVRKRVGSSS
jgi:hypothetical protein